MNAVMVAPAADDKRQQALLKAVGLDRVPPEQRELALAIADRYQLDLMLKHVVLIEGRPYITRDGLLHIAHRSGLFDGMEVTDPTVVDVDGKKFWTVRCSVYRKDMTRPFTYTGRYPTVGGNQKFAPEMATKVGEVMSLRRAFDVSAPVLEERWDLEAAQQSAQAEPPKALREQIAERRQAVEAPPQVETVDAEVVEVTDAQPVQCDGFSDELGRCRKEMGHTGAHRNAEGTWPQ